MRAFIDDIAWYRRLDFCVVRIAVTPEQVLEYGLETAPKKATDDRSFPGIADDPEATARADALPPDMLADLLGERIEAFLDLKALGCVK